MKSGVHHIIQIKSVYLCQDSLDYLLYFYLYLCQDSLDSQIPLIKYKNYQRIILLSNSGCLANCLKMTLLD